MEPNAIIDRIVSSFDGVVVKRSFGETAFFYNPGGVLPNGVYFCTIKENDGANDSASALWRKGVYRLAIGLLPTRYAELFGTKPARPAKGQIVATGDDFTALDTLTPHPVYAWMSWAQILNPSLSRFEEIMPLIAEAYLRAVGAFQTKNTLRPK